MYTRVETYAGASMLEPYVAVLAPWQQVQGYGTTPSEETLAVFVPLLHTSFPGLWVYAICAVIWPNGTIPPHQDTHTTGSQRFHLVLSTNPDAWVWHDGIWQQLEQDGVYTMDPEKVHAALNWGTLPRVHLVFDIVPDG